MNYRIEKKEAFRIVGVSQPLHKEMEKNFEIVPEMWQRAGMDGTVPRLTELMHGQPTGVLGVSACGDKEDWKYFIAVSSSSPVPEGMEEYQVPAATWAVFQGSGQAPHSIQELEKRVVTEWLPMSGYEYGNAPDLEVYLNANPGNARFEVWIPVIKKV